METVHVVQVGSYSRCSVFITSACRMILGYIGNMFYLGGGRGVQGFVIKYQGDGSNRDDVGIVGVLYDFGVWVERFSGLSGLACELQIRHKP